jgi:alkylation response protein AidB-like acyl-CoA dehydrogenase
MDALTNEQNLFRESVEKFLTAKYDFARRRKAIASNNGWDRNLWREWAEMGWFSASLPEKFGGLGGGWVEETILHEAFGACLVIEPYLSLLALPRAVILKHGSESQQDKYLSAMAAGKLAIAMALNDSNERHGTDSRGTIAIKGNGCWKISGSKSPVLGAPLADLLIVSASFPESDNSAALFFVETNAPGVQLREYTTIDGQLAADVTLDGATATTDAMLGTPVDARSAIEFVFDYAAAASSIEAVGAMTAAVRMTGEYVKIRRQFGQVIGKFQVIQHRLADMLMELEYARSIAYCAMSNLAAEDGVRARSVSGAKVYISKAAKFVGAQAVQLHGAIGMTDECAISHYFRKLAVYDLMWGDARYHLGRYTALSREAR